jgi:uncharacterized membrane protein YgcG
VEVTSSAGGGGGTGAAEDEPVLVNGGPTLDDNYPNQKTNDLADLGYTSYCGYLENLSATVPVVVTGLAAVDQRPAGSTAFTAFDGGECARTYAPCCDPGPTVVLPTCVGRTLPPTSASRTVCWMGVRVADRTGNRLARVRIDVTAVCTAPTGDPCRRVADRRPSPSDPVTVRWSTAGSLWKACFASKARGYYGDDRDGDGCPDPAPATGSGSSGPSSGGGSSAAPGGGSSAASGGGTGPAATTTGSPAPTP